MTTRIISGFALPDDVKRAIAELGAELLLEDAARNEAGAIAAVATADVWFGPGLTQPVLAAGRDLKWFQTASVGIEYFMYPELIASDIVVTNMRRRHTATSEHALALILSLARAMPRQLRQQARMEWRIPSPDDVTPLDGSTLLVLGTGQIGAQTGARASAFGMRVEGVNTDGRSVQGFARVHAIEELRDAVSTADWIVNALPFTPATKGIVSASVIAAAKRSAYFINVGRGKTVDQAALTAALVAGNIRGAALDVFQSEPLPTDDVLWSLDNVIVTPHSAGVIPGRSVLELGISSFLENLAVYQRGDAFSDAVDKVRGY